MRIFILGFGTVGQGVAELFQEKEDWFKSHPGIAPVVTGIADKKFGIIYNPDGIDLAKIQGISSKSEILPDGLEPFNHKRIYSLLRENVYDVLCELTVTNMSEGEPAFSYIKTALNSGHHVVTTNKGPIALYLDELETLAKDQSVSLRYEGTVLSGTPLINLARSGLKGVKITGIEGILNGTCNYILTRMEKGVPLNVALAEAQRKGYAEADSRADLSGMDSAAKLMILAAAIYHHPLKLEQIHREELTIVNPHMINEARKENKIYKYIGSLEKSGDSFRAAVRLVKLEASDPLAAIYGTTNAVKFTTDLPGEITISGPGAGKRATAYAVINDLISLSPA